MVYSHQERIIDALIPHLLLWGMESCIKGNRTIEKEFPEIKSSMLPKLYKCACDPLLVTNKKALKVLQLRYKKAHDKIAGTIKKNIKDPYKAIAVVLLWAWALDRGRAISVARCGYLKEFFIMAKAIKITHPKAFEDDNDLFASSCIKQMHKLHAIAQKEHIV